MCDLLWSDPDDRCGWGISPRGAGYTFGQVMQYVVYQAGTVFTYHALILVDFLCVAFVGHI